MSRSLIASVLLVSSLASPGWAADGVIEISQTCAAVGCFAGDSAGFPVTIGTPGSYRLTSNLSLAPNINVNAIEITTPVVTLDLAGFAIIGPTSYGGGAGTCAGGSGVGVIALSASLADAVAVSNGIVRGMGSHGIVLGSHSRVKDVIAEQNCGAGITVGFGSTVVDSIARRNGGNGIVLDRASRVTDSVGDFNGGNGIRNVNGDVVVQGCTANANGGDGINVGVRSLVRGNIANSNTGDGIEVGSNSSILENVVSENVLWGTRVGANTTAAFNTLAGNLLTNGQLGSLIGCNYSAPAGGGAGAVICPP